MQPSSIRRAHLLGLSTQLLSFFVPFAWQYTVTESWWRRQLSVHPFEPHNITAGACGGSVGSGEGSRVYIPTFVGQVDAATAASR